MDRSKLARRSRRKGKAEERATAKLLGKWWFDNERALRPRALSGGWSKKSSGDLVVDDTVANPNDWPFYVECKHVKNMLTKGQLFNLLCGDLGALESLWKDTQEKAKEVSKCPLLTIKGQSTGTLVFAPDNLFYYCNIDMDFIFARIFWDTKKSMYEDQNDLVVFNISHLNKLRKIDKDNINYIMKGASNGAGENGMG